MAWTYFTGDLSPGQIFTLEMAREWCAALQERYRALLGNSTAVVRMRGGTNGDHRIPLNQMIETSEDGVTFIARTPHGAFDLMDGGWYKESDLDSTGTATAEDFASALSGLGFTRAQLEASWTTGGVMSAKYWTYLRRVVQLMKVLPASVTYASTLVYFILNGDPEQLGSGTQAGAGSDATDWLTARIESGVTLATLPHIDTATRIWLYTSSSTDAAGAFTPGFTYTLSLGASSGSFSAPSTPDGSIVGASRWVGLSYPGGYSSALDLRPSNYGAYSTSTYNNTVAEIVPGSGSRPDAYIKPDWQYP